MRLHPSLPTQESRKAQSQKKERRDCFQLGIYSYICRMKYFAEKMKSNKILKACLFVLVLCLHAGAFAQMRQYKNMPDFDYADYDTHLKFMVKPFSLTGQTLYLQDVSDTNLRQYFFVGAIATPEKGDRSGVTYYKLSRMPQERIAKLKGEWFIVADYVADQFAYNKIYKAMDEKRDFKNMQHPFLKLVIGSTGDTVFYNYQNFYNRYNFPFTPMSYFNANKNQYPRNKSSNDDVSIVDYDTNSNYAHLPMRLVGHRLTLPVVTDETIARLFNGTRLYNYDDDSRKYSFTDYPIGKARLLEGKTFVVADWCHSAENLTDVYLKLVEKGRRDTIYYKYPTLSERGDFHFVIEAYYNKARAYYKDKDFVVRGDKFPLSVIDLRWKRPITVRQGDVFHCLDLVVLDGKFQMLMRNEKGRKFYMSEDFNLGDRLSFDLYLADGNKVQKYKDTYPTAYRAILQKELVRDMTMDMADLSWGKPEREVETNFDGSNRHWFYMGNIYIIFRNNKLFRVAMIPVELR